MIISLALFVRADDIDSTNLNIRDTIAFIQAQKEVHAYVSDNLSDMKVRIKNAEMLVNHCRNRIADVQSYNQNGSYNKGCDFYEQTVDYLKTTLNDLNRAEDELNKSQNTLENKIKELDRKINELQKNMKKR